MWHEARKQEKKLHGMMVDYRRRAERRREFYESIRRDPASYLQIHGQQTKIHIDPAISQAAELSLMPWMSDSNNLIDRFDVRAHLDHIPTSDISNTINAPELTDYQLTTEEESQLNYERFRNLVQNDFLNIAENKCLNNIYQDEHRNINAQNNASRTKTQHELKKKLAEKKAAISYKYDETDNGDIDNSTMGTISDDDGDDDDEDEEEFDIDIDTSVHVDQLNDEMRQRIGHVASKYGIKGQQFVRLLQADKEDSERLRLAKEIENEKAMFVGRKSRKERKDLKQQRLLILRSLNADETDETFGKSALKAKEVVNSSSDQEDDDSSEIDEGKVEFITCFGDSSNDDEKNAKQVSQKTIKKGTTKSKDSKTTKKLSNINKKDSKQLTIEPQIFGPMLPAPVEFKNSSFKSNNQGSKKHYRVARKGSEDDESISQRERTPIKEIYGRSHRRSSSLTDRDRYSKRHRTKSRSPSPTIKRKSEKSSNKAKVKNHTETPLKTEPIKSDVSLKTELPQLSDPPLRSYYRHDLAEKNELSDCDEITTSSTASNVDVSAKHQTNDSTSKMNESTTLNLPITPQERLRRLMQAQLDKEYQRDKKAAAKKLEQQKLEKQRRDEKLAKLSIRANDNQRSYRSSSDSDSSIDSATNRRHYNRKSRSNSKERNRRRRRSPKYNRHHKNSSRSYRSSSSSRSS
ncbi:hypothetical protein RDWZM_009534 [Blomia tropicalis]|uniref:Suppressor of white apricot N-terminal domain-containing protein n=1 Tax=Blomia tropicalis TaxID=40697 RepID=A0A9Q0M3R2_BLOTA|nr:hypothetical protein RDWZM_009534 [Blomia tropicalis]